jgi:hypothetical protein
VSARIKSKETPDRSRGFGSQKGRNPLRRS